MEIHNYKRAEIIMPSDAHHIYIHFNKSRIGHTLLTYFMIYQNLLQSKRSNSSITHITHLSGSIIYISNWNNFAYFSF